MLLVTKEILTQSFLLEKNQIHVDSGMLSICI